MPRRRSGGKRVDLREGVRGRLSARLAVVHRSAEALIHQGSASAERIHRFHSELRRLRVECRVWRRGLTPVQVEHGRSLDRRLSELARRVGEVRDSDVHLELLRKVADPKERPRVRERREEIQRRLADDARIGRELLRAYLLAEMEAGLFEEVRSSIALPGAYGRYTLTPSRLHEEVLRLQERLQRALKRANRRLSVKRAHRLRILLRRARYLFEFLQTVPGANPHPYPDRLVRLQRLLGRLHDLDLLDDWVEGLPTELRQSSWAGELRRQHRTTRRELAPEIGRKPVRVAVRGLSD